RPIGLPPPGVAEFLSELWRAPAQAVRSLRRTSLEAATGPPCLVLQCALGHRPLLPSRLLPPSTPRPRHPRAATVPGASPFHDARTLLPPHRDPRAPMPVRGPPLSTHLHDRVCLRASPLRRGVSVPPRKVSDEQARSNRRQRFESVAPQPVRQATGHSARTPAGLQKGPD